jgi:hypothetical protein
MEVGSITLRISIHFARKWHCEVNNHLIHARAKWCSKKKNRTNIENVQCMVQHMKLDHRLWAKVVAIVTYIQNQIPTKKIYSMTLKVVWCGYKTSMSHLHVFVCVAFAHVPKETRTKLDSKGVKCISLAIVKRLKGTYCTTL